MRLLIPMIDRNGTSKENVPYNVMKLFSLLRFVWRKKSVLPVSVNFRLTSSDRNRPDTGLTVTDTG